MLAVFILALIIHTTSFIDWLKKEKEQDKKANSNIEETPLYEIFLAKNQRIIITAFQYYIIQYLLIFLLPLLTESALVYFCILYCNYRISSIKQDVELIRSNIETMFELKQYDGVKHFAKYHPSDDDTNHNSENVN